jgi:hypothetical protein
MVSMRSKFDILPAHERNHLLIILSSFVQGLPRSFFTGLLKPERYVKQRYQPPPILPNGPTPSPVSCGGGGTGGGRRPMIPQFDMDANEILKVIIFWLKSFTYGSESMKNNILVFGYCKVFCITCFSHYYYKFFSLLPRRDVIC